MADAEIIDFGRPRAAIPARSRRGSRAPSRRRPNSRRAPCRSGALLSELVDLIRQALVGLRSVPFEQVRGLAEDPLPTLVGAARSLGVDWQASTDEVVAFIRSRLSGDYAIDDFGFDPEFTTKIFLPVLRPLVKSWFRVEVRGVENLPTGGSAMLVSNHAGTMPLDGMILHAVVHEGDRPPRPDARRRPDLQDAVLS